MIKISEIVRGIINTNETALEALRCGILNLSAYGEIIKPSIEEKLYKKIKKGTVVTALSRLAKEIDKLPPLRTKIRIEDLGIKSSLCEFTFEKTKTTAKKVAEFGQIFFGKGFFTSTQSISEITVIASDKLRKELEKIDKTPKGVYERLAAVTVRFVEEDYIEVPNMIYTMVAVLAAKRINIIELVSTYTEISFVVRQESLGQTVDLLKNNFLE